LILLHTWRFIASFLEKNWFFQVITLFIVNCELVADNVEGIATFGTSYGSNIYRPNLYELSSIYFEKVKGKSDFDFEDLELSKKSPGLNFSGQLKYFFDPEKRFSAEYSVNSSYFTEYEELSIFQHYLGFSYGDEISENLYINLNILGHHKIKNFISPHNSYGDIFLYMNVFKDFSSFFAMFSGVKAGYFKNIDEELEYFEGPEAGLDLGVFIYPYGDHTYIKISSGLDFLFLKDANMHYINPEIGTLKIRGSSYKPNVVMELKWAGERVSWLLFMKYLYQGYYNAHFNDKSGWNKFQKEHFFYLSPSVTVNMDDSLSLKLGFVYRRRISNLDGDENALIGWNYSEYSGSTEASYAF